MKNSEDQAVEAVFPLDARIDLARQAMESALKAITERVDVQAEKAMKAVRLLHALDNEFKRLDLPPILRRGIDLHCQQIINECSTIQYEIEKAGLS